MSVVLPCKGMNTYTHTQTQRLCLYGNLKHYHTSQPCVFVCILLGHVPGVNNVNGSMV